MQNQTQNIHIVFSHFAKDTLRNSSGFAKNEEQIICFEDKLSIGPVGANPAEIRKRKVWLSLVLKGSARKKEIVLSVDKDLGKINSIIESTEHLEKIYLWTGDDTSEIISTARLLSMISVQDVDIFKTNFSQVAIKNRKGETFYPRSFTEVNASQVAAVASHFEPLLENDLTRWQNLWEKVNAEESVVKVLTEYRNIQFCDETHFDNYLIAKCSNKFQLAAKIIGETLVETDFAAPDWFLNWRLKELAEMKRLEFCGEMEEMVGYEVKEL